jgi:hypothetical protein
VIAMPASLGVDRQIRALFVLPSELSSGEAVTVLHMATELDRNGASCACLCSTFAARFLEPYLGERVIRLTPDRRVNRRLWDRTLRRLRPDVVIFADYPFLFFSNGIAPLADEAWVASLERLDALPLTLDHLGYAQGVRQVFFGPPHLSLQSITTPELPEAMRVLLPCPMHEPQPVTGRRGAPFRYWDVPLDNEADFGSRFRGAQRSELLVVHIVSNWAWRIAQSWRLPHYEFLSQVLEHSLNGLPYPVTVVSVNNGELLRPSRTKGVRIRNSGMLSPENYRRLLAQADLLLTDNATSVSIGRAVCSLSSVAVFANSRRLVEIIEFGEPWSRDVALAMERERPGAVFPFEVFPIWNQADLDGLGLFRDNGVAAGVQRVELFGGRKSREQLQALLVDTGTRGEMSARQSVYVARLQRLPDVCQILDSMLLEAGLCPRGR